MKKIAVFLLISAWFLPDLASGAEIFNSYNPESANGMIYNSEAMAVVFDIGTNSSLSGDYYWRADDLDFLDVENGGNHSCGADDEDAFINLYTANASYSGLGEENRIYTHTGGEMTGVSRTGTVNFATDATNSHVLVLMRCVSELQDGIGIRANSGSWSGQFLDANNPIYTGKPKFCLTSSADDLAGCFPEDDPGISFSVAWPVSSTATTNFRSWVLRPSDSSTWRGRVGVEYAFDSSTLASSPTWDDYRDVNLQNTSFPAIGMDAAGRDVLIPNTNAIRRIWSYPPDTTYLAKPYWIPYGTTTRTYGDEFTFVVNGSVLVTNIPDAIKAGVQDTVRYSTSSENPVVCSFYNSGQCALNVLDAFGTLLFGTPEALDEYWNDGTEKMKQAFPFSIYYDLTGAISSSIANATTTGGNLAFPILGTSTTIPLNYGSSTLAGVVGTDTKNLIFGLLTAFIWIIATYTIFKLLIL